MNSRPQYLRIKGLALAESGNTEAARELWLRLVSDRISTVDAYAAHEHLGDLARREGRLHEATHHYRKVIEENPSLNGTTHMVEVSLAEMLLDEANPTKADEAVRLLQSALRRGGLFNDQLFRWHLALVRAAVQLQDVETQRRAARTALSLAEQGPTLSRHPTVGVVRTDEITLRWLQAIADGEQSAHASGLSGQPGPGV
jgi:predicted Zn-dependent protease